MPVCKFQCIECGSGFDKLMKFSEREEFIDTTVCGCDGELVVGMTAPARTPGRWGDNTGTHGVNGHFDAQLGQVYYTSMQREAIMREKGLVLESDLGDQHAVDDQLRSQMSEDKHLDQLSKTYKAKLVEHGTTYGGAIKAITETLPASDMLKES